MELVASPGVEPEGVGDLGVLVCVAQEVVRHLGAYIAIVVAHEVLYLVLAQGIIPRAGTRYSTPCARTW